MFNLIRTRHGSATFDEFLNIAAWMTCGLIVVGGLIVFFWGA